MLKYKWGAQVNSKGHVYAVRWDWRSKRTVYMHRQVNATPAGLVTDHRSGDTLDNRRENLEAVTQRVNCLRQHKPVRSSTGVRGVRETIQRGRRTGRFQAMVNGQHLGIFPTVELAARAREAAVREIELREAA